MTGAGEVEGPDETEHQFAFQVLERPNGADRGLLSYSNRDGNERRRRRGDRFESTSVTSVAFADTPGIRPSRRRNPSIDTVVFSGVGKWNGSGGYTFEARATDQGEPGRNRDTMSLTIKDSVGHVVATFTGTLDSGNVESSRVGH